jgi:hypothetical protein
MGRWGRVKIHLSIHIINGWNGCLGHHWGERGSWFVASLGLLYPSLLRLLLVVEPVRGSA